MRPAQSTPQSTTFFLPCSLTKAFYLEENNCRQIKGLWNKKVFSFSLSQACQASFSPRSERLKAQEIFMQREGEGAKNKRV